jgi:hypothetical protein
MSKFDITVEATAEVNKVVAVLDRPRRIGDQHPDACVGLGQYQSLDDLEKVRIIVNAGFEIVRKY